MAISKNLTKILSGTAIIGALVGTGFYFANPNFKREINKIFLHPEYQQEIPISVVHQKTSVPQKIAQIESIVGRPVGSNENANRTYHVTPKNLRYVGSASYGEKNTIYVYSTGSQTFQSDTSPEKCNPLNQGEYCKE